jgi:hypothetical protein
MTRRVRALPLLPLLALMGCAGSGRAAPPAALAYRMPRTATADYVSGDSARIQIEAGGQRFAVSADVQQTWRMAFAAAEQGVRVTATLTGMQGTLQAPMSRPQTADQSAVQGPVVFTLDPRGRATVERLPTIKPAVAQFLSGAGIAQGFFPRLPGRAAGPGQSWTDTVGYTTDESGAKTTVQSITTYTVAGDSTVGKATYLLVRTAGTTRQTSGGTLAGTEFSQDVQGTTTGHFLWDRAAGLLRELEYHGSLTGTMRVAIAPAPLPVTVSTVIRARRVEP